VADVLVMRSVVALLAAVAAGPVPLASAALLAAVAFLIKCQEMSKEA
jgi:hypothetical protein